MKLSAEITLNLKIPEALQKCKEATRLGLRDTIVAIANDSIKLSPKDTGNNMRSIFYGVAGMGKNEHKQASPEGRKSGDTWTGADESLLDESKLEAATYSTSGYGGFLETGTIKMGARPYFRPALDMHGKELPENIKRYIP